MKSRIAGTNVRSLFCMLILSILPGLLLAQTTDRLDILFIAIDEMND